MATTLKDYLRDLDAAAEERARAKERKGVHTKAELLKAPEPFADDAPVFIRLHQGGPFGPDRIIIQGVDRHPAGGGTKERAALVAHPRNAHVPHED